MTENPTSLETFGRRLARVRIERGFSQEVLASELGVSNIAVSHWERDRSLPRRYRIESIAEFLDVPVADLLGITQRASLREEIDRARRRIANAAGIESEKVRIIIEL